jgi:sulfite exporter TauE/SafE
MDQTTPLIKTEIKISGMVTFNEEIIVIKLLLQIDGAIKVYAHHKSGKAEIYATREITVEEFQQTFTGYNLKATQWGERDKTNAQSEGEHTGGRDLLKVIPVIVLFIGTFLVFKNFNFVSQAQNIGGTNLWVIFLTGLTVGGLTCLAVQGGLLASVIAEREEESALGKGTAKHAMYATGAFLVSKYVAYVTLGFLLGAFGGALNIGGRVQTVMQLVAGLYMIAVALNLLNIHPIFRYAIIQPPRFLTRMVRNQSKSKDLFAPSLLGAMTVFIPCGTTIAMEALAISSANGIAGASIMAVFILGTMPLFFGIGAITSVMGEAYKTKFLKLAAVAVIYLGVTSINGSLVVLGSPLNLQAIADNFPRISFGNSGKTSQSDQAPSQNIVIEVTSRGYTPDYLKVNKGKEVTLTLKSRDAYSCASAFRIPSLGISRNLAANDIQTIKFTPDKEGRITFACSMGMYRGVIEVV